MVLPNIKNTRRSKDLGFFDPDLSNFLELCTRFGKTGRLNIRPKDGSDRCELYFKDGTLVYGEILSKRFATFSIPQQPVIEALGWENPEYEWEEHIPPKRETMKETIYTLRKLARDARNPDTITHWKKETCLLFTRMVAPTLPFKILIFPPDGEPYTETIFQEETLIGRECGATLYLDHSSVSREHSKLLVKRHGMWIQDLDSTNGTRINGIKIEPGKPAAFGFSDALEIGKVRIKPADESMLEALVRKIDATHQMKRIGKTLQKITLQYPENIPPVLEADPAAQIPPQSEDS